MTDPDQAVEDRIDQLIEREHELRRHAEGRGLSDEEQAELQAAEVRARPALGPAAAAPGAARRR